MNRRASVLICGLLVVSRLCAQETTPTVDGLITRAASASDFDIRGIHVRCSATTQVVVETSPGRGEQSLGCTAVALYVGEPAKVFGSMNKKEHAVNATRIKLLLTPLGEISGAAVIDAPPNQDAAATGLLVRADGYRILISARTKIAWKDQLHELSDVKAGDWIEYQGKATADGTVVAASVKLTPNLVSRSQQKLRDKNDFDPSAVPSDAKQSPMRMAFVGIDPKRFPPYNDPAMQDRVAAIGKKLIPAYQLDLPDSDPSKIQFRFQVIDTKLFRDALTMPSGVILVPRQVVERMQNDAQLAAVLADNIACALEEQTYRALPASRAVTAGYYASQIGGLFVPGLGLAGAGASLGGISAIKIKAEEQSGRVSLGLLQDAGYDIFQAPIAWWLLAPKVPKRMSEIAIPNRATYLYEILGQQWHSTGAATKP